MAELIADAEWMKTLCPACKRPLALGKDATGYIVWCARSDCNEMADGPNEGGHGKTPEKALGILLAKLGIDKNYRVESEAPEEPETKVEKAEKPAKGKKGKRGRKSVDNSGSWTVPIGQFTMKEFCEKNETYPYKAIPFFKEKGVEEVGVRKTTSGRGKPAVLYEVKI